ncbi:MAG: NlpC/P60 family protein, partial [Gemmatimonadaceae bacterium]
MLRLLLCPALAAAAVATTLTDAVAQRVTLSPFVTLLPVGSSQPMAGLAFTLGGGPFALRAGGHMSTQARTAVGTSSSTVTMRPWGADADALAYLESLTYGDGISFSPYVFAGLSTSAIDSASVRFSRRGWSYGSGLMWPLGSAFALFGEWRWRMSRFVLPNAQDAPAAQSEARLGLSFRIGGGSFDEGMPVIPMGDDGGSVWEGAASAAAAASRVLTTAEQFVGTKYRRGGMSPSSGFDAAGFVRFVFARFGVILPRTSRDQARVGERVRPDWQVVSPGDLVMFQDDDGITHVAI